MQYATTQTNINAALPVLAAAVLDRGDEVSSRNGRCKELTHVSVQLTDPCNRAILLPARRASLPAQIAESMWILAGRNDIEWLSHYLPRAADFSDDGVTWRGGYGPRIRSWDNTGDDGPWKIDQLAHVVSLLREDPMTRRAVINIYDPTVDTAPGKDIPCNNWLHFLNREGALDLAVTIRSNDLIWGWSGINAFEWSVLLEVVASLVGVQVGTLTFHISSLHIYEKHWKRAGEIRNDTPVMSGPLPRFGHEFADVVDTGWLDTIIREWFYLEGHIRNNTLTDVSAIDNFPEPMMRSWLRVLQWWWGPYGNEQAVDIIGSSALAEAAVLSRKPQRAAEPVHAVEDTQLCSPHSTMIETNVHANDTTFRAYVADLHKTKDAAYGDSWCRRGEMLGILANVARKVDRLGKTDELETAADTAVDLWVYLLKYRLWLSEHADGTPWPIGFEVGPNSGHVAQVSRQIGIAELGRCSPSEYESLITALRQQFDQLEADATDHYPGRWRHVEEMSVNAAMLARSQWAEAEWRKANATRSWNPEAGQ